MNEFLGPLVRVPLGVTEEPRSIIDEAHQQRLDPTSLSGQHLARTVMEVEVDQLQNVLDLVAADLTLLQPHNHLPRPLGATARGLPAQQTMELQITQDARVGRTRV